jgi:predicted metalloprotease with PDZ domain
LRGEGVAVKIFDVTTGSHADKAGIKKGETLLSINSNEIVDVLDYRFYQVNRKLTLEVADEDKNVRTIEMTKGEYEEIGLSLKPILWTNSIRAVISAFSALLTSFRRVCVSRSILRTMTADFRFCSATISR